MNKKVLASLGLAVAVVATSMPVMAYTTSTASVDETKDITANVESESCTVHAEVGSQFTVTIPKKITLGGESKSGSYTVTCTGNIAGDEYVLVKPDETFAMSQSGKKDVTATVTQATTMFRGDNYVKDLVDGEAKMASGANGSISAQDLTAGSWNGTFNFEIELTQDAAN